LSSRCLVWSSLRGFQLTGGSTMQIFEPKQKGCGHNF